MRSRAQAIWTSLTIGALLTALDLGAALLASAFGKPALASHVYWLNAFIQTHLPCLALEDKRFCEGTPWNVVGFWASIPLSVAIYAVVALFVLRSRERHHWRPGSWHERMTEKGR